LINIGRNVRQAPADLLLIDSSAFAMKILIHGSGVHQGELMQKVATFSDEFQQRFRYRRLTESDYKRLINTGELFLRNLEECWPDCQVTLDRAMKAVLFRAVDSELLTEVSTTFDSEMGNQTQPDRCCLCPHVGEIQLSICGHWYCLACFRVIASDSGTGKQCQSCHTLIYPYDFKELREAFAPLLGQIVTSRVRSDPTFRFRFCPGGCSGLLNCDKGYQRCPRCEYDVCPNCGVVKQKNHAGRTCEEFKEFGKQENWISRIFVQSRKWTRRNWSQTMPAINAIDVNPCLFNRCLSLQRFLAATGGVQSEDPIQGLNIFFAWHGSARDGVIGISCEGWKPSLRAGQCNGPGEYFGFTADISAGYCKGCSHMIVALIIRNHYVTEHGNFCYVVNNPVDDRGPCYCLPLAVVTFGSERSMTGWRHNLPARIAIPEEEESEKQIRGSPVQSVSSSAMGVYGQPVAPFGQYGMPWGG
jgi:hypothetical protein